MSLFSQGAIAAHLSTLHATRTSFVRQLYANFLARWHRRSRGSPEDLGDHLRKDIGLPPVEDIYLLRYDRW